MTKDYHEVHESKEYLSGQLDQIRCVVCGACGPKDDAYYVNKEWYCEECFWQEVEKQP